MKIEQYTKMVDLLISATIDEKMRWTEHNGDFSVNIDGCQITLSAIYDVTIDSSTYTMSLINKDGVVFGTYTFDENSDKNEYGQLNRLYWIIKDKTYKISESENIIMNGLKNLLNDK